MTQDGRQRVDRWLFFARIVKSRSLGAKLVAGGKVRLNREKIDQPARAIRPGDVLTVTLERGVGVYRVLAGGTRRGPASEARTLYEELTPPAAPYRAAATARPAGTGRPTKKERRDLDAWRDGGD